MNGRKWHQYANNVNVYEPSYQSVGWSGTLVDMSSVCHNFLKGWEVTLPCSYRSICASRMVVWLVGQTVCRSVCHKFLKMPKVSLPCSYCGGRQPSSRFVLRLSRVFTAHLQGWCTQPGLAHSFYFNFSIRGKNQDQIQKLRIRVLYHIPVVHEIAKRY